jgi:hypothetical protein
VAEAFLELRVERSVAKVGVRPHLIDAAELYQRSQLRRRIARVDVERLVVAARAADDAVDVQRELVGETARHAERELIRVRLNHVVRHHRDVRRRGCDDERGRIAAAVRVGVGRIGDVDGEPLVVEELAERAEHPDVAVVQAVRAADHGAAVAAHVPRESGARTEVVPVAALRHIDERQRHGKR